MRNKEKAGESTEKGDCMGKEAGTKSIQKLLGQTGSKLVSCLAE